MKQRLTILCMASLALLPAGPLSAAVYYENGDAGQLPASAQAALLPEGEPLLTEIYGSLDRDTDIDMYRIKISDPANFSAVTSGGDTQLFLFDINGKGIVSNDDDPGVFGSSRLPLGSPLLTSLLPGFYYLAVSGYNHEPLSGSTQKKFIFPDTFNGLNPPSGLGGDAAITDWSYAFGDSFDYTIVFTGVEGLCADCESVPDTGRTLALLAFSLGGVSLGIKRLTRVA